MSVAVVGFAEAPIRRRGQTTTNGVELLVPVFHEVLAATGLDRREIDFWCSGSSDYLAGRSFSFVSAIDAIGVLPPVNESHVEMDAAWALYEAWVKIQTGDVDTAIVFAFGKSSAGVLRRVLALQLDPYTMTPLWPDTVSLAALQARLGLEAGLWDEKALADVVARSLTAAEGNENAVRSGATDVNALLVEARKMIERLIGADVELVMHLAPGIGRVVIDPGHFDQVVMNLVVNARDAMPDGGKLTIDTADVVLDVFAPRNPAEFHRVLRPTGRLIVVRPTRRHLAELGGQVPAMVTIDPAKEQRLHRALNPLFEIVVTEQVEYSASLTRPDALDLVAMTPSARHVSRADLNDGGALPDQVTVSVLATAYRPR